MIFKQYYLACLSHASYLIGDEQSKTAVVVDPQRDIDHYLADAASHGMTIKYVFLTHFHADFLAGHIEMRDRTGAVIALSHRAPAEFKFEAMHDGQKIDLGQVRLEMMETPGHTPEGLSILVYDLAKSQDVPHAVLTGDTLFIGDVGRPDLLASVGVTASELAEMLYESVNRLRQLPDSTLVYPAHGAGSLCGKSLSSETFSTMGEQKKFNYALQPMPKDQFIALVTADQPEAPDYFVYDAIKNRKERPSLDQVLHRSMRKLSLDEVLSLAADHAQVVDVREPAEFAGAHLKGSINISLKGKFATWAGTILSHDQPIVVIAEEGGEEEAVTRLGRIGFDNVTGYLDGGLRAIENRPDLIGRIERITAMALAEQLGDSATAPTVLDVRNHAEWERGHLEGSINIPLNHLESKLDEIPRSQHGLVVHCESGYRSSVASSILAHHGFTAFRDLVGGYKAWAASSLPVLGTGGSCSLQTGSACATK